MRIDKIEAVAISIPLKKNFGGATYDVKKRCTIVTRLHAGGLVSEVYNGDNRAHGPELVRIIKKMLAPIAIGADIFAIERLWEKMFALTHSYGDRKNLLEAISCIDCAVWDLYGKALGKSIRQLLGGYRSKLPIISIGGYYVDGKTLGDYGREVESYRKAGMAGCKFKVGGLTPEQDFKRVQAARKAAGDDFVIVVDANRGWNVQDAIKFSRLIEPLDITWFEEPCHWHDDVALMARVRQSTRIPVNAGQCEITSQGVRRLVDGGAVDFRQLRRVGGRRDYRLETRRVAVLHGQRAHGAPRRSASRAAPTLRGAAWHVPRMLRRPRPRSGMAENVAQSPRDKKRYGDHRRRAGTRHRARSEDDQEVPRRLNLSAKILVPRGRRSSTTRAEDRK
jgi:L-alanine-DL-glutamate epimerase-like enolase superfamily enzyme